MKTTVNTIFEYLNTLAPVETQMSFDNSGLQIGQSQAEVKRVLTALDLTTIVAQEAIDRKADLIVTHHPLIFHPLRSVTDHDPVQNSIFTLIQNDIAVISMHTNLDIAENGVNDALIRQFSCTCCGKLNEDGCGRIGNFDTPVLFEDFLSECKNNLQANGLRYVKNHNYVKRAAFMGGSGSDYITAAIKAGCDTYITADIKYHDFIRAYEMGLNLIDADHFCTENPVIPYITGLLKDHFPEIEVIQSGTHKQIVQYY